MARTDALPRLSFKAAAQAAFRALLVPNEAKSYPYMRETYGAARRWSGTARVMGSGRADAWDMDQVIAEGYERSVWTYRCVELISGSQSRLPFRIGRNLDEDDEEVLDDHPLYRVLNVQANPLENGRAFRKRLSAQILLSKRGAFIEVTKSRAGTITRLDLLDPSRVTPQISDKGDYIDYYEYVRPDGQVDEIAREDVRWVREPHPTDPFSGTTPLEAAGLSIELDFLSRQYNVSFIKNDSRPGGILTVDTESILPEEMDRIETRFKGGAYHAGELAIIGTGVGGAKYIDTTTRPRDMNYGEMAERAKDEILSAFGIGESVLGNASGRTFDNAEQEEYNFWTKPMPPHLDLVALAFQGDIDNGYEPFFDTSKVDALEAAARRRRQEAREEFNAGLRSIDEYRPLTGLPTLDNPQSRALWVSPAKAPVPGTKEDAAALLGGEGGVPGAEQPAGEQTGADGAPVEGYVASDDATTPDEVVDEARSLDADGEPEVEEVSAAVAAVAEARAQSTTSDPGGEAANAVATARSLEYEPGVGFVQPDAVDSGASDALVEARVRNRMEGKSLTQQVEYEIPDGASDEAEAALRAVLDDLLDQMAGVIEQRISAPKARKGTRFWEPEYENDTRVGSEALAVDRVLDVERWARQAAETASPVVQDAAIIAGLAALSGLGDPTTGTPAATWAAGRVTAATSVSALAALDAAVRALLDLLRAHLAAVLLSATTVDELRGAVREFYGNRGQKWAKGVAGDLGHMVVCGATERAALHLAENDESLGGTRTVTRAWITRRDDRVRPTHRAVHGRVEPVGTAFQVGTDLLMYPQDPTASPQERIGCRCRLRYSSTRTA
ncbi:phage portal protein [Cellulosimicrobium cellulans]|uniref:phage portal protein n=1 Tax=Cellulosimicrobium cellulans TaxID=1710 RepID=UPI0035DBC21C